MSLSLAKVPGTILRGVLAPKSNLQSPRSRELASIVDLTLVESALVCLDPYTLLLPHTPNPGTIGAIIKRTKSNITKQKKTIEQNQSLGFLDTVGFRSKGRYSQKWQDLNVNYRVRLPEF